MSEQMYYEGQTVEILRGAWRGKTGIVVRDCRPDRPWLLLRVSPFQLAHPWGVDNVHLVDEKESK